MSTAAYSRSLLDESLRPSILGPARVPDLAGGGPSAASASRGVAAPRTLDDVLCDVWSGLRAASTAECPICHGSMQPRFSAHGTPVGGRCHSCGSTLG